MKKIFLSLFLLAFIIFPQQASSLTYKRENQTGFVDNKVQGNVETEGFFGTGPDCKKKGFPNFNHLRQGSIITILDGTVRDLQKGLFDCKISIDGQTRIFIYEGLVEFPKLKEVQVYFKTENNINFMYRKVNGKWYLNTKNSNYSSWSDQKANVTSRLANKSEENEAENLFKFYKTLDLSSSSAKIYGDKIFNNNNAIVKKESTPKKNDWINKYNDNDIIPANSGTGFFINRDGILLSNYHVIQGCASVSLYHNGVKYPSNIIASDRTNDIAIISSTKKSNQYFRVDKEGPSLLEEIFVAGYPLGLKVSNALKVSSGRVSSLAGFGDNYANFQLDAAINPGNSGGPIINKKGNVVGIAVAYLPDTQGFNFGIKSSTVNSFVNSNKINFSSPNTSEMSTKELSKLMNEATVFIECSMKVKDIKAALEKRDTKKVFYSEFRN
jgi:S1-C subfamily serine protease